MYSHFILISEQLIIFTQNNHFCDSISPGILFWPAHKDTDRSWQKVETWKSRAHPTNQIAHCKAQLTSSQPFQQHTDCRLMSNGTYCDAPAHEMHGDMIARRNMICHQHFWIFIPHFLVFFLHKDAQHNTQGMQHKTATQHCWTTDKQEYGPIVYQYDRAVPFKVTGIQHDKHQTET